MSHHFFFEGVLGTPSAIGFRPGDYTVDGGYSVRVVDNTPTAYLFDSAAQTAVGNSDFVIINFIGSTTATDNPSADNTHIVIDCQGDAGSGSLIVANSSTNDAKKVIWVGGQKVKLEGVGDSAGTTMWDTAIILPSGLFGTADSTRTGIVHAYSSGATVDIMVHFQFCSWNPLTGDGKPGNFTVQGGARISVNSTQNNYLITDTGETAADASDFVIIQRYQTGTGDNQQVIFDFQGDSGSGSLLTGGTGTTTAKNVQWTVTANRHTVVPASLIGTDSTRTGRQLSSASITGGFVMAFISWN